MVVQIDTREEAEIGGPRNRAQVSTSSTDVGSRHDNNEEAPRGNWELVDTDGIAEMLIHSASARRGLTNPI